MIDQTDMTTSHSLYSVRRAFEKVRTVTTWTPESYQSERGHSESTADRGGGFVNMVYNEEVRGLYMGTIEMNTRLMQLTTFLSLRPD